MKNDAKYAEVFVNNNGNKYAFTICRDSSLDEEDLYEFKEEYGKTLPKGASVAISPWSNLDDDGHPLHPYAVL